MIQIDIHSEADPSLADPSRIRQAIEQVLAHGKVASAEISVAVVDNATIWELNRRHLEHDYATDVLSFQLSPDEADRLEGEVIVSYEMAIDRAEEFNAAEFDWPPAHELLFYVVHGALHLIGYEDASPEDRASMYQAERDVLAAFDIVPPREERGVPHS